MAVLPVSQNQASIGSNTTIYVPYPDNPSAPFPPQSGQTMWMALEYRTSNGACTEPTVTGWATARAPGNGSGFRLGVYYRQGDASTGSAIATWNVSVIASGVIMLFDGTHTVSPLNAIVSTTTLANSLGLHTISSVTSTVDNCGFLGIWGGSSSGFWENHSILTPPDYEGVVDLTYYFTPGMVTTATAVGERWFFNPIGVSVSMGFDVGGAAGPSGSRTATSLTPSPAHPTEDEAGAIVVLIAIAPYSGPSRPTLTAPVDAETITIGRTYTLTWTASTDPTVAQSALTYNIDYSLNDGLSWTQIVANTSAGVTTYAWNTTSISPSPQVKIRIRAHNGTEYSSYYQTGRFILAADVTPGAPTGMHGEQPAGTTVTLFDRTLSLVIKGTFNDTGDVMTAFQLDWGTDGVTYGNTSTNSTSTLSKTYAGSTFSAGTVYFRCRTADNAATYGGYTYFQLLAASPPATPNITTPTAASPPSSPLPTIAWTSTSQVKYRVTITQGGIVRYAGAFISSSSTSITSPFSFLNDTVYVLSVDYQDSSGLTSPADSETFTVHFAGPAAPSVIVT